MRKQRNNTIVIGLSIVLVALVLLTAISCTAVPMVAEAADATVSLDSETLARYRYISQAELVPQQYEFEDLSYTEAKAKDINDKLNALESASKALTALKFASKITAAIVPNPTVKVFLNKLPSLFESTKRLFINSYIFETGHMTQDNFAMMSDQLNDLYDALSQNLQYQTETLISQMTNMQNYIVNTLKLQAYGETIDEFLNGDKGSFGTNGVGYYDWKEELLARYSLVERELSAAKPDEENLEKAFKNLYRSAVKVSNLYSSIVPHENGSPTDYSILDVMYEYYLLSSDASGRDYSKLNGNIQSCISLAEDVYSTYLLASAYLSMCYQYMIEQMGGVDDSGKTKNEYYTLDGSTEISFTTDIKPYINNCETDLEKISGFISNYYARLINIDQVYYLKTGDYAQRLLHYEITDKPTPNSTKLSGTEYEAYLNVNNKVPKGAQIILPTLPIELIYQLRGVYKFSLSKDAPATVTDDGIVTVTGDSGEFDVSLTCGDSNTVVYTQHFEVGSSTFAGGGTPNFPYIIQNATQLSTVANNSTYWGEQYYFRLANDITLSSSMPSIGTADNPFKGSFDGGNHSVKGLKTNALFGSISGSVSNLTIEDANVTSAYKFFASASIGILANENNGTITNCHVVDSTVSCSHNYDLAAGDYTNTLLYIGGLVGANSKNIANCSVTGTTVDGFLTNSIFSTGGAPEADKAYAGGIAGRSAGSVSDCLSTDNTIKLKIHSVSYYANIKLWGIVTLSEQEWLCTAYFIRGGLIGEASGSIVRSIAHGNDLPTLAWSHETAQASGNGNRTKDIQAVDDSKGNAPFVGNNSAQQQSCYQQSDLPSTRPLEYAGHGWNWVDGKPANNASAFSTLSVASMPFKTIYKVGDDFNPAGLALKTDLEQIVTEGYDISGFDSSQAKRNTYVDVTATWKGHSVQFQVYVMCPHTNVTQTDEEEERNHVEGVKHIIKCSDCGEELSNVWESTGVKIHHWDSGQVQKEPNCTEQGEKFYTCTDDDCDETYTEAIPATGHQWVVSNTINPTCEHDGKKEYQCSVCGAQREESINRTGHDYHAQNTQPATCLEDGYTEYKCSHEGCETPTYRQTLYKLGHDHQIFETHPATCTDDGYVVYKCARENCDDTYQETLTKLGHDYKVDEQLSYPSTCAREGLTVLKCSRCNDTQNRTEAKSSTHVTLVEHPQKAPTYTEDGNLAYWYCEVCRQYFKDKDGKELYADDSWLLPKYGLKKKFADEVSQLDKNSLESLSQALSTYYQLNMTERAEVAESYGELQQAINQYNEQVNKVNSSHVDAKKSVGALLGEIASGFIALAALLSVLKRQF